MLSLHPILVVSQTRQEPSDCFLIGTQAQNRGLLCWDKDP